MFIKIIKSVLNNFQSFVLIWIIILVINQVALFHACFKTYCILAALPHTGILAVFAIYIINFQENDSENKVVVEKENKKIIDSNHHKMSNNKLNEEQRFIFSDKLKTFDYFSNKNLWIETKQNTYVLDRYILDYKQLTAKHKKDPIFGFYKNIIYILYRNHGEIEFRTRFGTSKEQTYDDIQFILSIHKKPGKEVFKVEKL